MDRYLPKNDADTMRLLIAGYILETLRNLYRLDPDIKKLQIRSKVLDHGWAATDSITDPENVLKIHPRLMDFKFI